MNIVNIIIKCDIIKKLNFDLNYKTLLTKLNRNIQFTFFKKIQNWKNIKKETFFNKLKIILLKHFESIKDIEKLNN